MKDKQYTIKTMQDIVDIITPENVEHFSKDFEAWLLYIALMKSITDKLEVEFIWTDDNVRSITITLESKKE